MKCFYHPVLDAVATCAYCGKATCHQCVLDNGGNMTCVSCYNSAIAEHNKGARKAKARIIGSWVFAAIAGVLGVAIASQQQGANSFLVGLAAFYCAWSVYWGVPAAWGWWTGLFRKIGCFLFLNPIGWLIVGLLFFYIPLVGGYMYGIWGGGIYQFFKYRKIARSTMDPVRIEA